MHNMLEHSAMEAADTVSSDLLPLYVSVLSPLVCELAEGLVIEEV